VRNTVHVTASVDSDAIIGNGNYFDSEVAPTSARLLSILR